MSTILLYRYNNYYNRQVKRLDDNLSSYASYKLGELTGINFNPNDGVETELIVNWSLDIPDYLIVSENNTTVASRWFVLEAQRTRSKQFKMTLRRDLIVDNYNNVISAKAFIEKAKLPNSNKLIYNQEEVSFNQIKKSETLLKDETGCPWIVGYISRTDPTSLTVNVDYQVDNYDFSYANISSYWSDRHSGLIKTISGNAATIPGNFNYKFIFSGDAGFPVSNSGREISIITNNYYGWDITDEYAGPNNLQFYNNGVLITDEIEIINIMAVLRNYIRDNSSDMITHAKTLIPSNTQSALSNIFEDNGKIIKDTTNNKYYLITVTRTDVARTFKIITASDGAVYVDMKAAADSVNIDVGDNHHLTIGNTNAVFGYSLTSEYDTVPQYQITLTETNAVSPTVTIPATANRLHLVDAPYDMFCMPYSNSIHIYHNNVDEQLLPNSQLYLCTAMSMASAWSGSSFLYDVQLLPYCPLAQEYIRPDGNIDYKNMTTGEIKTSNNVIGRIFFLKQSEFSINIASDITVTEPKIENQTDMYRLCSPNYNGMFEFNAARNGGVEYFDIDCSYRPYQPYIHVNPVFGGLYGQNYHDPRGLICNGDFSLPVVSDAWSTYEIQNKNYQNIFNRQIQNMDFNNKMTMVESGLGAITGTMQGALTGAFIGGGAGAVVGGALSLAGGIGDQFLTSAKQNEAKSYATDTFEYQLGNIKALPDTLSKVSSFNRNNKIFPFIEFYSCTDEEKNGFRNKIQYNGMTVGIIDTISNYVYNNESNYLKAKIIRLDNLAEDYHLASQIANEINKGVYI